MDKYDSWKLSNGLEGEKVFCNCSECGGEIYIGEEYIQLNNGAKLHTEGECFEYYIEKYLDVEVEVAE